MWMVSRRKIFAIATWIGIPNGVSMGTISNSVVVLWLWHWFPDHTFCHFSTIPAVTDTPGWEDSSLVQLKTWFKVLRFVVSMQYMVRPGAQRCDKACSWRPPSMRHNNDTMSNHQLTTAMVCISLSILYQCPVLLHANGPPLFLLQPFHTAFHRF